jgi:hypothetical protein
MSDEIILLITTGVIVIAGSWLIWRNEKNTEQEEMGSISSTYEARGYQEERKSSSFTHEARGYQLDSRYYHGRLEYMHSTRESAETGHHVQCNNHDHLKYMHSSRQSAEAEVRRMKQTGFEGSERLNAYFNCEHGGWYVGKSW